MDDLISRQAAIDALETVGYDFSESELSEVELEEVCGAVGDVRQDMIGRIKRLPSAEPKRGKWNRLGRDVFNCNKCGATFVLNQGGEKMRFCPNCGADMREVTT